MLFIATLFLLCCLSYALVLNRQKALAYAHNGQAAALYPETGRPTGSPNLHAEMRWILGCIHASVTQMAAKIAPWARSLFKGKTNNQALRPFSTQVLDEDDTALVQHFEGYLMCCLMGGQSKEEALLELRKEFPLDKALIEIAYQRITNRKG